MWAWRALTGRHTAAPAHAMASGSYSNYGGDAAMAEMGTAAQRRYKRRGTRTRTRTTTTTRRRRRPRAHARRAKRTLKVRAVGTHPRTGKKIFQGHSGGRFTRGLHGNKTYL